MSIEAIKQVTQVEAEAKEKVLDAQTQAKHILQDADLAGQLLLEQAQTKADAENHEAMAIAEKNAAARTEQLLSENAIAYNALCDAAEKHLDAAAELIIKRIVNI